MKRIVVELTLAQARELRLVAGNGYDSGQFYEDRRRGRGEGSYLRAIGALEDAIEKATDTRFVYRSAPRREA